MADHANNSATPHKTTALTDNHRHRIKHSIEKAEKYQHRKAGKHQAEMALIRRALPQMTGVKTILDAPCGVGRATIMLAQAGYEVTGIDLGEGALELAEKSAREANVKVTIEKQDLVKLDYADRQFDAVLCFRLIHHLPTPHHRAEIIGELCRVAKDHVLISYHSPCSLTAIKRLAKRLVRGRRSVQNTTPLSEICGYFHDCGYTLVKDFPQLQFIHTLHLALFRRNTA